jgi:dihydroceramidase
VFAALVLLTGFRVTYLVRWSPHYTRKIPGAVREYILRMFWTGGALFLFGFLIWNLDNVFCGTLTQWKVAVGWPVAFLLEGG